MACTEEDWERVQDENINGPEDFDDGCDWYHKVENPNMEGMNDD